MRSAVFEWLKRKCRTDTTYRDLCLALSDGASTVYWCQRHKLLSDSKIFPKCGRDMHLVKRKDVTLRVCVGCPRLRKGCRKEVSLRSGTYFEGTSMHESVALNHRVY